MLGATTAVSRRTGGLLSSGGDELGYGFVEQLGLLPLHPVAALGDGADGNAGKEIGELIAPGGGEDRVVLGPEDQRGRADGEVSLEAAAHGAEHGAVAVEAAAQGAGLGERLHVPLYLFVRPERLVVRPVGEEVAQVDLGSLPAGADKLLGQGELVEEHVPDLAVAVRGHETAGYAGIGGLEEYEAVNQVRMGAGEALCPDGAEVVGDDVHLFEAQVPPQRAQVFGHDHVGVALLRRQVRLAGGAVASHVRYDDIEPAGEGLDVEVPLVPEAGPAVNEEEGRPAALADIVVAQAVNRGVLVVEASGLAQAGAAPIGGGRQVRSTLFADIGSVKPAGRRGGSGRRRDAGRVDLDMPFALRGQDVDPQWESGFRRSRRYDGPPQQEERVAPGQQRDVEPPLAGAGTAAVSQLHRAEGPSPKAQPLAFAVVCGRRRVIRQSRQAVRQEGQRPARGEGGPATAVTIVRRQELQAPARVAESDAVAISRPRTVDAQHEWNRRALGESVQASRYFGVPGATR